LKEKIIRIKNAITILISIAFAGIFLGCFRGWILTKSKFFTKSQLSLGLFAAVLVFPYIQSSSLELFYWNQWVTKFQQQFALVNFFRISDESYNPKKW
jgi:hypothetical protein